MATGPARDTAPGVEITDQHGERGPSEPGRLATILTPQEPGERERRADGTEPAERRQPPRQEVEPPVAIMVAMTGKIATARSPDRRSRPMGRAHRTAGSGGGLGTEVGECQSEQPDSGIGALPATGCRNPFARDPG
jgi:hypothetical protein